MISGFNGQMIRLTHLNITIIALLMGFNLTAGASFAAGGGKPKEGEGGDPYVKLASVAIPVFETQTVVNYIFVSVRLNLTPKADVNKLREKEPYFRNQLVQAAYKTSFALPDKNDTLDEAKFKKIMLPEFSKISGPGMIETIEIVDQMPKKRRR